MLDFVAGRELKDVLRGAFSFSLKIHGLKPRAQVGMKHCMRRSVDVVVVETCTMMMMVTTLNFDIYRSVYAVLK